MGRPKDPLFVVDGFEVREGHNYIIKHKPDSKAPSGLQQEGTTKVPTGGAGDTFQCPYVYDPNDPSSGVWDSGMTEYSPCYQGYSQADAKSAAKNLYNKIGLPYERSIGKTKVMLDIANEDEFWTHLDFTIEGNKMLKTSNPKDVLTLYYGLRQRVITPPDPNGYENPKYSDSAFRIIDVTKDVTLKDERASAEFDAITSFSMLLKDNKAILLPILKWVGIRPPKAANDGVIKGLFKTHLASPNTAMRRIEEFNQLVEDSGTDQGREKLLVFDKLDELNFQNKISKNNSGALTYDNQEIGLDMKSAALNIATKPAFKKLKTELIIGSD